MGPFSGIRFNPLLSAPATSGQRPQGILDQGGQSPQGILAQGGQSAANFPATVNPMIARQIAAIREAQFMQQIQQHPWYLEFIQEHKEKPNLSRSADYDYRRAWAAGLRPTPDPYDNNRYHWPSSLPNGEMLKSADHPTAWKEHFMRATGKNPDALGLTEEQAMQFLQIRR